MVVRSLRATLALLSLGLVSLTPAIAAAEDTKPAAATSAPAADPASDKTVTEKTGTDKEKAEAPTPPANETFLHVQSPTTIRIEDSQTGQVVCTSPCDKPVPSASHYRIGGARPSPEFVLASSKPGRANVKVKPGSNVTFWTGAGALALGGLLIGTGVGVFIYGVDHRPEVPGGDGTETDNTFTDTMSIGSALAVVGTISALVGGAIMVANSSTKVRGDVGTTAARLDTQPSAPRAANLTQGTLPRTTFAPLFGGTF